MPDTPHTSIGADADFSGRQLGDFHLLRRLGRGAMADVYLAEQSRLKRRVAVKILRPELAGDRTYVQRFEIEAQAAAALVHANIVQIYEVGCIDRLHFIAQEYVQGQNLQQYVARHGPPDLSHALSIMRQVAAALAKAAERGVVHRDIKPENIMLTAGGEVKVADFGLARIARNDAPNDLTQVGMTLGTPLYMSPEQVEGRPLDPRSDIYSFGVTCYHMLSGRPPFSGETALAVAVQHLKKQPDPLASVRADLPPSLCRIVHQMLAKDPSQRFASARDLLRELRRVQIECLGEDWPDDLPGWESLAAETHVDARVAATQQLDHLMKTMTIQRYRSRRRAWLSAAIVLAFLLGSVAAWAVIVPRSMLANTETAAPAIPKQRTVLGQWYLASQLGTVAAWQSVIDYFPEKRDIAHRAEQQLALIYLREDDLNRAMTIFENLSNLGDDDAELRAFGLAGKCGVFSLRGNYAESNAVLGQLLPIRDKLTSQPMIELVEHAVRRNSAKMGSKTSQEWDKWFEERFRSDG